MAAELRDFRPALVIVDVFNEVHRVAEAEQDQISRVLSYFTALAREACEEHDRAKVVACLLCKTPIRVGGAPPQRGSAPPAPLPRK